MQNNEILMLPNECWRWIPGYEGIYQVSTRGRVRSVDRWVTDANGMKYFRKGRILKQQRTKKGYLRVDVCRDGKERPFLVHRMVAMAWLDNPEGKPHVNHLDENPGNPDVFNLSWATAKENANWGTRNKRAAASKLNGRRSKSVQALDPNTGAVVLEFPSVSEARRNGFSAGDISQCCRGIKLITHHGLIWRYKDDYDQENTWTPVKIGMESMAASKSKVVLALDPSTGAVVMEFPSTREAERNGFNSSNISACCLGKRKTHHGFAWRYKES